MKSKKNFTKTLSKSFPEFPWKIDDIESELEHIKKILSRNYELKIYPEISKIFRAFELVPQNKVNVVIIGQDPYNNGVANGLAFSIDPEENPSNNYVSIPKSLEVIFNEIKRTYDITENHKTGDLTSWAEQGVLLLNHSLTVFESKPNSHEYLWSGFTHKLVRYLNREYLNLVFMLWGSKAAVLEEIIDSSKHLVLTAPHPAAESYSRFYNNKKKQNKTFIGCSHFKQANDYLLKNKNIKIDWLTVFD